MGYKGHRLTYKRPNKRFRNEEKKLYPCDGCGKSTTLPFRPRGIKPVYCRHCFKKAGLSSN